MNPPDIDEINANIVCTMFGYKDSFDYYYKSSCTHRIAYIKKPTLFINSFDDPVLPKESIDFDNIRNNRFCILATSQYGGHMGYNESVLSMD